MKYGHISWVPMLTLWVLNKFSVPCNPHFFYVCVNESVAIVMNEMAKLFKTLLCIILLYLFYKSSQQVNLPHHNFKAAYDPQVTPPPEWNRLGGQLSKEEADLARTLLLKLHRECDEDTYKYSRNIRSPTECTKTIKHLEKILFGESWDASSLLANFLFNVKNPSSGICFVPNDVGLTFSGERSYNSFDKQNENSIRQVLDACKNSSVIVTTLSVGQDGSFNFGVEMDRLRDKARLRKHFGDDKTADKFVDMWRVYKAGETKDTRFRDVTGNEFPPHAIAIVINKKNKLIAPLDPSGFGYGMSITMPYYQMLIDLFDRILPDYDTTALKKNRNLESINTTCARHTKFRGMKHPGLCRYAHYIMLYHDMELTTQNLLDTVYEFLAYVWSIRTGQKLEEIPEHIPTRTSRDDKIVQFPLSYTQKEGVDEMRRELESVLATIEEADEYAPVEAVGKLITNKQELDEVAELASDRLQESVNAALLSTNNNSDLDDIAHLEDKLDQLDAWYQKMSSVL